MGKTIITFGTFDLFHIGHLNIIKRARSFGDKLIIGLSTDEFNSKKKNKLVLYSFEERKQILQALKYVDEVFPEESMENKRLYIQKYSADVLVMGSDWEGKFDNLSDICEVIYLPRTPSISTTETIERIRK